MAKTVDNFATIEDFRKQYNELAYDVGDVVGLNATLKGGSVSYTHLTLPTILLV